MEGFMSCCKMNLQGQPTQRKASKQKKALPSGHKSLRKRLFCTLFSKCLFCNSLLLSICFLSRLPARPVAPRALIRAAFPMGCRPLIVPRRFHGTDSLLFRIVHIRYVSFRQFVWRERKPSPQMCSILRMRRFPQKYYRMRL